MENINLKFNKLKEFVLNNKKTSVSIIVTLLLVISIPLGVYLAQNPQIFKSRALEIAKNISSLEQPEFKGYIVEFKDEPLVKTPKDGVQEKARKDSLTAIHEQAKADIFARLKQGKAPSVSQPEILGEYFNAFNGIALDITSEQVEQVKQSSYVKNVYPNLEVKANLNESVPLIGADKVWNLKNTGGENITGKGVNVAVLDTGVDMTHSDLGASKIAERDFQKIITDSGWYFVASSDRSKFATYEDGKIYVYSSSGQKLNEFSLLDKEKYISQMVIEGNYLAYFRSDAEGNNAGVSLYNLTTGEHEIVDSTNVVGTMHIYGDTLYYGTGEDSWIEPNPSFDIKDVGFSIYDISTKNVSTYYPAVSPMNTYTIMGAFDKKRVAFPVPEKAGDFCAKSIYVLGFEGNVFKGTFYTPPDVGLVLDFKGDEILYMACNSTNFDPTGSSYYLFNIKTGTATKLAYLPTIGSITSGNAKFNGILPKTKDISTKGSTFNWNRYNLGLIGDSVVYFKKDFYSTKVVIYNKDQQKYYLLNPVLPIRYFVSGGDTLCFNSSGIYCHTYDPSSPYSLPTNIFNSKVVGGYNFISPDEFPLDDHGHGTHVAATIAGVPPSSSFGEGGASGGGPTPIPINPASLIGVAPGANIIAYKVLDSNGSGSFATIINAIDKAVATRLDSDPQNDISIVSMSLGADCWGNYSQYCGPDDPASKTVDNAVDAGIAVVIAAGNSGPNANTIGTPGTARKAITVGAVDKNKQLASFSSRGPVKIESETINKPDVVAPGVSICAAEWSDWLSYQKCADDKHIAINGTSMATPHVAGLVALMKQAKPDLLPAQIKEIIKNNAQTLGLSVNDQGAGIVDALKSITVVMPTPTPTPILKLEIVGQKPASGSQRTIDLKWNSIPGAVKYNVYARVANENNWGPALLSTEGNTGTIGVNIGSDYSLKVEYCDNSTNCISSPEVFLPKMIIATPTPGPAKRVFITSRVYNGNLGGLVGADSKCQARADTANLGGTWKAWLSDSKTSAVSRLTHNNGIYKLVNGTVIASDWADLTDGNLQSNINISEFGKNSSSGVWTGTQTDGSASGYACADWRSSAGGQSFLRGDSSTKDFHWTASSSFGCSSKLALYCFEQ